LVPDLVTTLTKPEDARPNSAGAPSALGAEVAPGVHEAELDYLCREEWAQTGHDVLWRRSKLGLHLDEGARQRVADWMAARQGQPSRPENAACN
jgi:glycerol-3-phosphate dehydrogenase